MQKLWFRLCSLFLVIAMSVNMLPLSVLAEEYQEIKSTAGTVTKTFEDTDGNMVAEAVFPDAQIVEEVISQRTEYSKQFRLENGLFVSAVYSDPVHYEKDGQWTEIDNTLTADLDGTYRNTAGIWDVSFPNNLGRGDAVSITKDGYTLSFSMAGALRQLGDLEIMSTEASDTMTMQETALQSIAANSVVSGSVSGSVHTFSEAESQWESVISTEEVISEKTVAETAPQETIEVTVPQETEPEATEPETVPEVTIPEETIPEAIPTETIPEAAVLDTELELIQPFQETVKLSIDGISQTFAVQASQTSYGKVQKLDLTEAKKSAEYPELVLEKSASKLLYSNVYSTTDVQYDLQSNRVKESIILKAYDSGLRGYRYTLNTGSLVPELQDDGSILFYDEKGENIVMVMPAPYLLDANYEYNDDVRVSLTGKNGIYTLIYLLPQSWLASSDRVWPVVLDPVVQPTLSISNITDHTVSSKDDTISKSSGALTCGCSSARGIMRIFLKYENLPKISSSDVIVEANVYLYKMSTGNTSSAMKVHKVTKQWDISEITWAGWVNEYDTSVEDVNIVHSKGHYTWQITDLVRDWYTGTNTGMMFKLQEAEEDTSKSNYRQFISSDYTENNNYQPSLVIKLRNSTGLEDYWDYTSASAGRAGAGYVNTYTGSLTWIRDDIGFGGNRMPVSISHAYDLSDAAQNDFGVGYGWRTNYHQRVYKYKEDSSYYVWEDGDGTRHYFKKSGTTTYKDEDGLELTFDTNANMSSISGEDYIISDKNGNARYFDEDGRLICQSNNQKEKSYIAITYVGDTNRIDTITDGAGRKYQFNYTNDLLNSITYTGSGTTVLSTVSFGYTDGNLTSVTDNDGETSYYTYSDHNLVSAQDIDGYKLQYTYQEPTQDYQTYRVTEIAESDDGTKGGRLTLAYEHNQTTMTDINNNKQILQFNSYGNVVSIQDGEGRAQYAKYAANTTTDTGKANQLTFSSKLQYTVTSNFYDSSFEGDPLWSIADSTAGAGCVISTDEAYMGNKSQLFTAGRGTELIGGSFYIPAGETYTFSAYVKVTAGTARLGIWKRNDHSSVACSQSQNPNSEWTRLEVSYTNKTNSQITAEVFLQGDANTTVYLDCVQLENTPTASRYNLVSNGDFRYSMNGWDSNTDDEDTAYVRINTSGATYAQEPQITAVAPQLDTNCVTTSGDPKAKHRLKQTIQVSGEKGDTYVFGGWGLADSAPLFEGAGSDGTRYFCVAATFHYTDGKTKQFVAPFNASNETNWQYVSEVMVAEKPYNAITIQLSYNYNANRAKFDGIQLFKEEFGTSYAYDDDGNIISVVDLQKQTTEYEYDGNKLTAEVLPSGARLEYDYDKYNNVIRAESEEGLVYDFTYDKYGNNLSVSISNEDSDISITSSAAYSTDGNRMMSTTDAQGYTTQYGYNENTNILEWIQYPEDTDASRTEYDYDSMHRLASVNVSVLNGTSDNPLLSSGYVYEDDYLTKVTTNSTTYNYDYGNFGLIRSVSIDKDAKDALPSIVLTEYEYTNDGNNYLKSLDYRNGGSVNYTYDNLGRVLTETNEDENTVTYKYDNSGALATIADSDSGKTTTYYYDFTDRLLKYAETGTDFSHSVGYEYDKLNNLTAQIEEIDGTKHKTTYTYDKDNRVTAAVVDTSGMQLTYDDYGRVSQQTTKSVNLTEWEEILKDNAENDKNSSDNTDESFVLPGNTVKTDFYTFNESTQDGVTAATSQVKKHSIYAGSYNVSYEYTYDKNGNITEVDEIQEYDNTTSTKTTTYVYDSANQLIRENNPVLNQTTTWTYDNAGNITGVKEYAYTTGVPSSPTNSYVYHYENSNWGDLLTGVTKNDAKVTYSSDDIGNLLSDGTRTYTWKHGRELATLTKDGVTYTYTYDANGMRASSSHGTTTSYYVYTGDQLVQVKTVTNENTENESVECVDFAYDSDGTPMSMTYTQEGNALNGTYYYLTNVHGDVVGLTDSSGNIVIRYNYSAYGQVSSHAYNTTVAELIERVNPLLYRGYVFDADTGLYYLQSRYYDPQLGRFINADDAVVLNGGSDQILGNNLFAYCFNNPVNRSDNAGTWPSWATKVLIGTAVIAAAAILTVATAGTGTALACFAVGALKGAVAGAAMGAVSGAATGAVTHRITTGSWDGAGQAALEGAADGYMSGAISGFISGGATSNACFVAGTTILTAAGTAAIETIKRGDYVWAWDEETGDVALKEVVETYVNESDELIHLFVNGEEIITTPSHPFYSPVKGWTSAVHLRAGDILVLVNGEYVVLEKIQHEILESPVTVYNFQVEDYHTYYVGEMAVLVHNVCKNPGGRHGGTAHRAKVDSIKQDLTLKGWKVSPNEVRVSVGNGKYRYPDVTAVKNGITRYYQVGRQTLSGRPIARELRALRDLGSTAAEVYFVPYLR